MPPKKPLGADAHPSIIPGFLESWTMTMELELAGGRKRHNMWSGGRNRPRGSMI